MITLLIILFCLALLIICVQNDQITRLKTTNTELNKEVGNYRYAREFLWRLISITVDQTKEIEKLKKQTT